MARILLRHRDDRATEIAVGTDAFGKPALAAPGMRDKLAKLDTDATVTVTPAAFEALRFADIAKMPRWSRRRI